VSDDALKSTTVATSPYARELKTGEHELRLTGAPRPFDNDSRSPKTARARGLRSVQQHDPRQDRDERPLDERVRERILAEARGNPLALARGFNLSL
jgi:hypothetical protein